jgi:ABC-2 type transport system permease protein
MIADAGVGLHALIWASPLGWVEQLQTLTAPQPLALLPIAVFVATLSVAAGQLAGIRDVGSSLVDEPSTPQAHLSLLRTPTGLAVRMVRPTVVAWWAAIAVAGLLYGFISKSAGATISGSSVQKVFSKLGAPGSGVSAVLGVCFVILAVLVAALGAGQVGAARAEEATGRLDHLLVCPLSRMSWLVGRLSVALCAVSAGAVGAGVFAWFGAASQHSGVAFVTLLDAGVNLIAPALSILGIGVLVLGIAPRLTSVMVYGLLTWSLLVEIVGGVGAVSHWILDTSVFHQMASAPAVSPHWGTNAAMTAVGVAAASIGAVAFARRDLQGE